MMNLVLLGGAAWLAYNYFFASDPMTQPAGTQPAGGAVNPATGLPVQNPPGTQPSYLPLPSTQPPAGAPSNVTTVPAATSPTEAQPLNPTKPSAGSRDLYARIVMQMEAEGGPYNLDQWMWFAQQYTGGTASPNDYFSPNALAARTTPITLQQWLADGGANAINALIGATAGMGGYLSNYWPTPVKLPVPTVASGGWGE